jgi:TRAP transporter TAXI family solute receptor
MNNTRKVGILIPGKAFISRLPRQLALATVLCGTVLSGFGQSLAESSESFHNKLLQLGTGPQGGAFRPIGNALCDAVNEDRGRTLVRCVPVATAGTTFNLQAVADGSLQLALAQEDLLAEMAASPQSVHGRDLRVVALMHTSPIAIMVRKSDGITSLHQIAGKVVNLGNRGSGQFAITAAILKALDLRIENLRGVTYAATSEFERLFCEGKVDVVVEAVAHPADLFRKLRACGGEFLDVPQAVQQRMKADNRYLTAMAIPAQTYDGQDQAVTTLGMRNVLVTNAAVANEAIFRFTLSLQARLPQAQVAQAVLRSVGPTTLATQDSLPVPLHPGAARALAKGKP